MAAGLLETRNPFRDERASFLAGRFGIRLFILSLVMLFGATLIGFIVIRVQLGERGEWPVLPSLPAWLLLSTLLLVVSSGTVQASVVAYTRGAPAVARALFGLTFALGVAFLAIQAVSWIGWLADLERTVESTPGQRFAWTSFYVLTGTHAAHVIGGLVPMGWILLRPLGPGVRYCAAYWHFLGGVWLGIYAALAIGM